MGPKDGTTPRKAEGRIHVQKRDTDIQTCFHLQVKVNLGGGPRQSEDGNVVAGKMLDMVVEQDNVFIVREVLPKEYINSSN